MDLLKYIKDSRRRAQLARDAQVNPTYLYQIATGWKGDRDRPRRPSAELANRIERHTRGIVTRESLRPDIFGDPRAPNNDAQDQTDAA